MANDWDWNELKGSQLRELRDAMVDAFPDRASLAELLDFELDVSLDTITSSASNLNSTTFTLVRWSQSHGRTKELFDAAIKTIPGNAKLKKIKDGSGGSPPGESSPADTRSAAASTSESAAVKVWREKLEFFQTEEAKISDPAQKFSLQQQIAEAKQKIQELGGN